MGIYNSTIDTTSVKRKVWFYLLYLKFILIFCLELLSGLLFRFETVRNRECLAKGSRLRSTKFLLFAEFLLLEEYNVLLKVLKLIHLSAGLTVLVLDWPDSVGLAGVLHLIIGLAVVMICIFSNWDIHVIDNKFTNKLLIH